MITWELYGAAALTSPGFFWKAGWAFVLGYSVSAMIQAFVPKGRLTPYLGDANLRSASLATLFGAASSSRSFAAAVAFMFASTNLVIELGILILLFLGWQFLAAEIVGGLLLIGISTVLIKLTYPKKWFEQARETVDAQSNGGQDDFDWRKRVRSREGWNLVGHRFVSDWKMVRREILIGFTVAGFVAVLVPASLWASILLTEAHGLVPGWLIVVENAMVAPLVAAATFIGSMGKIPLATVLNSNGVTFAGIVITALLARPHALPEPRVRPAGSRPGLVAPAAHEGNPQDNGSPDGDGRRAQAQLRPPVGRRAARRCGGLLLDQLISRGRSTTVTTCRRRRAMNTKPDSAALSDPESTFREPRFVVANEDLSHDEKVRILLDWRQDLIERQTASDESMLRERGGSNVGARLQAVTDALIALGYESP